MSSHESSADITNLQEALAQQQQKITALREMVRKSDNSQGKSSSERNSTTEKVKNITKQLTHLKAKAQGAYYSGGDSGGSITKVESIESELNPVPALGEISKSPVSLQHQLSVPNAVTSTTGSEKVALLRQQMEQNKLRLAQRASSKLHLEQMVSDLKNKLDSTQQCLEDTSELGKSMTDLSIYATLSRSSAGGQTTIPTVSTASRRDAHRHRSATELSMQPAFNLEKERIKFLENRCRLLEKQLEKERQAASTAAIELPKHEVDSETSEQLKQNKEMENRLLELEKLLQERQQEIEAKTIIEQQLTLENERLRNDIDEYLRKRTSDSHDDLEKNSDDEKQFEYEQLQDKISRLSKRVAELEEVNDVLETARCDLSFENNEFKEKLKQMDEQLLSTQEKLEHLTTELNETQRKYLELQTEKDEKEAVFATENTFSEDSEIHVKAEMAKQIQELQEANQQLTTDNSQLKESIADHEKVEVSDEQITAKISNLEATIESQREDLAARHEAMKKLEEELMEKTIELNVLNANFGVLEEKLKSLNKTKTKPLFSTTTGDPREESDADLQAEVQQLKQKLDESNKAMIKLKLKCKQSEKQIEKLKKGSKLHEDLIEQQKTNEELQQRITELEDEKGQWQLSQMDDGDNNDTHNKETETIRLLEQQKFEQLQQIESLQQELDALRQQTQSQDRVVIARVESQLSEIQLEEQLEEQKEEIINLQQQLQVKDVTITGLEQQTQEFQLEKQNLEKKLEHYLSENMELLDKVDKLSKSSSSAESIEIVDRLTQQERAEIDEFNKRLEQRGQQESHEEHPTSVSELTQTEMGFELSESLTKLREESSELMNKVAMFTTERREVLEKMEHLNTENQELQQRIDELTEQKAAMQLTISTAEVAKNKLESELEVVVREKELLSSQVAESTAQKAQLSQELTSMQRSSEIVAALDNNEGCANLFDKCEKSLVKLDTELEAYRRANDKNAKFNASKKLAKEAKNAHTQLSELLLKVKEASTAVETVTVVETVVAVTAPNGKALAEYEQLTAQNRELKATVDELRSKLEELEDTSVHETISEMVDVKPVSAIKVDNKDAENDELRKSLEKMQQYEKQCNEMRETVDELHSQLSAVNIANEAKTGEIRRLNEELAELREISDNFDKLMNDKEMSHEQQIEKFTKIRKELEGKCEVYQNELEILQTLVTEQKQQLIEAYKEHEHEMNLKLLDLQQRDEQLTKLRTELTELRQTSRAAGAELSDNLEKECEKLRESLRINKALTAEQINELANKQETIDMMNQQIIDLYKSMEDNTNKVIEKEDEIADMEAMLTRNNLELERLKKDNEEQKAVVDKLLNELHTHKENKQQLMQLESELQTVSEAKLKLESINKDLEKRSKEQLEKLKKFAANLKKRTTQCQELETKIKNLESKASDSELQQEVATNVVLLNERISDYEMKCKNQEAHIVEIQEALQAKTIEILEFMENNDKLDREMKELKLTLAQRDEAIVQLQNALSASQEQTAVESDWGDTSFGENNNELNEQLENAQSELLKLRELLMEKEQAVSEANNIVEQHIQNELTMKERLKELQTEVDGNQHSAKHNENELQTLAEKLKHVEEELSAKALKFEKSKAIIKERNNQIQRLQAQIKELQEKLAAQPEEIPIEAVRVEAPILLATAPSTSAPTVSKCDFDALQSAFEQLNAKYDNEKATFESTIARLETLHDGIQAKLQEDMSYIETLELENSRFKEKICKLEECVGTFEERRASMERRANLLDAQMQSRADEYVKAEDELIYRLNMLSEHDEVIGQRLLESQEEKDELQDRLDKLHREYSEISTKYTKLEKEHKNLMEQNQSQLDAEVQSLRQRLEASETESQRQRATFDAKLAAKTTEIDELESELSEQLARINAEKRALQEDLEKSRDNCSALKDEIVRVNESLNAVEQSKQESERELTWLRLQNDNAEQDQYELQELRMQSMQDKTELDNLRQQIDTLANNHHAETDALRLQIAELDSLRMQVGQNQTDDQVFIENENKRLSDLLNEKEAIIAEYQRQNLQLQMSAPGIVGARNPLQPPDLFASLGSEAVMIPATSSQNRIPILEQDLAEKTALITRLQNEMEGLREGNSELQRQLWVNSQELETLRSRGLQTPAPIDNTLTSSTTASSTTANDIIPAPPMFFSTNQMTPSPFDEIVQRRHEQPQYSAAPSANPFASEDMDQQTIENLQRNVSDLEKYTQELENKLSMRNNAEEDLRQRLNETLARQSHTEEQVQVANRHLLESEQQKQQHIAMQSQLEKRIAELEVLLKERDDQLQKVASTATDVQLSAHHMADLEQRIKEFETTLHARDAEISELTQKLCSERRLNESTKTLESQIIATPTIGSSDNTLKPSIAPSLDMFFGNATAASSAFEDVIVPPQIPELSSTPVVEDIIVPEKAYICHPRGEVVPPISNTFNIDLDDSWGGDDAHWGAPENIVEASNFAQTSSSAAPSSSLLSREQQLELDLQMSNDRFKELEVVLKESETQRQKLQEKLAKSMKVVGKYKAQNEELKRREQPEQGNSGGGSGFFDDLDAAIQDELKNQIKKLEAELEEQHKAQRESSVEKEKLLKRIDVLSAGNERMTEMKERQDMDMEMYKTRINELQRKLSNLEDWGAENDDAGGVTGKIESPKKTEGPGLSSTQIQEFENRIKTLAAEVDDLNGDKQELQALLDDERLNLTRSEQQQQDTQKHLSDLRDEYEKVCAELNQLKGTHASLNETIARLQMELDDAKRLSNSSQSEAAQSQELKDRCLQLEEKLQSDQQRYNAENAALTTQQSELQKEIEKLRSELETVSRIPSSTSEVTSNSMSVDELAAQLQERDDEIVHLKQRIEDLMREDQTEKLVLEILSKNQEIHLLKMQVKHLEDDKLELEHNLTLQITKEMQEQQLVQRQAEEAAGNKAAAEALKKVEELEAQVKELQSEKQQMEEELSVLNAHVMGSLEMEDKLKAAALDLDTKNIEIKELRQSLESMRSTASKVNEVETTPAVDITALNSRWEAVVEQRCSEIAQMWRTHLEQRESEFQAIEHRLKMDIEALQKTNLSHTTQQLSTPVLPQPPQRSISMDTSVSGSASSTPVSTVSATSPSASAESSSADASKDCTPLHIINEADADEIIAKMQTALENQEMEIVSLKEQLAIRSAEYARLAAQYDPFKLQSGSTSSSLEPSRTGIQRTNDTAMVPKSELDLALYILHQRDMRCEEMTVELVALLEERDTLQLKLSNTLRQVEAIKAQTNYVEPPQTNFETTGLMPGVPTLTTQSSDSPMKSLPTTTSAEDNTIALHQKLSQLQTVNHSKDKLIKEEREHRSRQMERIQQDVAKIPTAAVSQLIGTDISQTSQSPSSVLLNWLWGNKPPAGEGGGATN